MLYLFVILCVLLFVCRLVVLNVVGLVLHVCFAFPYLKDSWEQRLYKDWVRNSLPFFPEHIGDDSYSLYSEDQDFCTGVDLVCVAYGCTDVLALSFCELFFSALMFVKQTIFRLLR